MVNRFLVVYFYRCNNLIMIVLKLILEKCLVFFLFLVFMFNLLFLIVNLMVCYSY